MSTSPTRHNAVKHGLTAKHPLIEQERQLMQESIKYWTDELGGEICVADALLIRRAAVAGIRLERCDRAEEAGLGLAFEHAQRTRLAKKRHAARKLAQSLPSEPYETRQALQQTTAGCDWLIGRWKSLDAVLIQGLMLKLDQFKQAMHLEGFHADTPGPDAPLGLRQFWSALLFAYLPGLNLGPDGPPSHQKRTDNFQPPPGSPTDAIAARAQLRQMIAERIAALETLRDEAAELESASEEIDILAAVAMIDTSKEAKLRHRYAKDAEHTVKWSFLRLSQIRRERREIYEAEREAAGLGKSSQADNRRELDALSAFIQRNKPQDPPPQVATTPPPPTTSQPQPPTIPTPPNSAPSPNRPQMEAPKPAIPTPTTTKTPTSPPPGQPAFRPDPAKHHR
jgi:hypothetical protein